MFEFSILLTIIVITRGFLIINEQFLVAFCFLLFLFVSTKFGDQLYSSLTSQQQQLSADHHKFTQLLHKHQQYLHALLTNRFAASTKFHLIYAYFQHLTTHTTQQFITQQLLHTQSNIQHEIEQIHTLESHLFLNTLQQLSISQTFHSSQEDIADSEAEEAEEQSENEPEEDTTEEEEEDHFEQEILEFQFFDETESIHRYEWLEHNDETPDNSDDNSDFIEESFLELCDHYHS